MMEMNPSEPLKEAFEDTEEEEEESELEEDMVSGPLPSNSSQITLTVTPMT